MREAAGTLSGVALGEDDAEPRRDVLADVLEAFGGDVRPALARRWPSGSPSGSPSGGTDASGDAVSAECRARGVPSVDRQGGRPARPRAAASPTSTTAASGT